MSDDIFEAFGDEDTYQEEEAEAQVDQVQGQNRVFIIAVAVLGGLLVCALISFGVWALVLNRPQQAAPPPTEVAASPTAEMVVEATSTPAAPEATNTPQPTDTPEPTSTPVLGPTATPTAEGGGDDPLAVGGAATATEPAEEATPTATQEPRRTPTPTRTPRATATPRVTGAGTSLGGNSGQLSQTGLGEWLLIGAAVLLVGVMITARRLRRT